MQHRPLRPFFVLIIRAIHAVRPGWRAGRNTLKLRIISTAEVVAHDGRAGTLAVSVPGKIDAFIKILPLRIADGI